MSARIREHRPNERERTDRRHVLRQPAGCGAALFLWFVMAAGAADLPDPEPWAQILAARVDDRGLVDYRSLAAFDLERLRRYLESLATVDPEALGHDQSVAFWLNAHNALVVLGAAHGYDPEGIEDRARLYHWLSAVIGGRPRTVDEIRGILDRYARSDPRIHLAACSGTRGSPPLAAEPYRAERLDSQLAAAARKFVNDARWNEIDIPARRAALSALFEWYRDDFERAQGSVADWVANFVEDRKIRSILRRPEMTIGFAPFDWRLNAIPEGRPESG